MTTVDSRLTPSMVSNSSATPARVALLGFGTVGQSVARILCSGEMPQVQLTHIFNRHVARKRVDWVPASVTWTESADEILASDVDIVIELVGGLRPAYDWVKGALMAGKSVVTANKQLMAHHGTELLDLARSRGLEVRFEASVAGGIPVLRALQEGLAGDRLVEVRGILNGTCAYILSRMQIGNDLVRRRARRGAARRLRGSRSQRGSRRRRRRREAGDHCRRRSAPAGPRDRHRDEIDPTDRAGGLRIRARARMHDPPDCARVRRGQRRGVRGRASRARAALVRIRTRRGQPESGHRARHLRRRDVVLRIGRRRFADGRRGRLRRAVGRRARHRRAVGDRRRPRFIR